MRINYSFHFKHPLIGTYQFYELINNELHEFHSGSQDLNNGGLIQIGSTTYFIIGSILYKRNNDSFNLVGKLSDDLKFLNVGWGRNENDIFIGMRDGIAHYNGENTVYLYKSSENIFIRKGIIFNNEVFFLAHGSGVNIIIHGILNDKL